MDSNRKHIVIIGGGITGLSAAYYTCQNLQKAGIPHQVTLVEKSPRLGGSIQTLRKDGFVIEKGPDSFLARKPAIIRLSRELGLDEEWVGMNPLGTKSFIYLKGKLHPMPEGLALGIPTRILPFMRTSLLSISGKARAALDFVLPRKAAGGDESIGSLIQRRLGREVADHLVGPVLAGIYASDLQQLSTAATFPQLRTMEREHRSIILGMVSSRKSQRAAAPQQKPGGGSALPAHLKGSMFLSFKNGLITLVERLQEALQSQGVRIMTGIGVESLSARSGQEGHGYSLRLTDGTELTANGVIMAMPATQTAAVLENSGIIPSASQQLRQIPNVSVANVAIAVDTRDVPPGVKGSGFVVPRNQGLTITACTWASNKWMHTAPQGKTLIRAYIGHAGDQSHTQHDDATLLQLVQEDMRTVLGSEIKPLFTEITRHPQSMPQYLTGHLDRLQEIDRTLSEQCPSLILAGRSYRGVGIPDCIQQGFDAANRLL